MEDYDLASIKTKLILEPRYMVLKMMLDVCRAVANANDSFVGLIRYTDKIIAIAIEDWRIKEGKKNRVTEAFITKNAKKIAQFICSEKEKGTNIYAPATMSWVSERVILDTDEMAGVIKDEACVILDEYKKLGLG